MYLSTHILSTIDHLAWDRQPVTVNIPTRISSIHYAHQLPRTAPLRRPIAFPANHSLAPASTPACADRDRPYRRIARSVLAVPAPVHGRLFGLIVNGCSTGPLNASAHRVQMVRITFPRISRRPRCGHGGKRRTFLDERVELPVGV